MHLIILLILFPMALIADLPRQVLAFWDSRVDHIPENSLVHTTLEMPLNYLGLDVVYHDIQNPLPILKKEDGIRGIILCFREGSRMPDPIKFIDWALEAIESGKKIVMMRHIGFEIGLKNTFTPGEQQNRLFEKLGFRNTQNWIDYPYDYEVISSDKSLTSYEKNYPNPLEGFYITRVIDPSVKSYLKIGIPDKPESESDLVIIGPRGAYISESYANNYSDILYVKNPRSVGWYINPFRLFELVFGLLGQPVPDPTTLAGRRIFFATCHGDNWNTGTRIEEYASKRTSCAQVILEKVVMPNPDLPIAVGVVAADVDPNWVAKKDSQEIARKYFALPQVEAASHTYSHPFFWDFFRIGAPDKEIDYLYLYRDQTWKSSFLSWLRAKSYQVFSPKEYARKKIQWGYTIPRAYAVEPFQLDKEISGAVDYLNQFAPDGNKIKLLVWSGDSRPWDTPLALTKKIGINNFGGGFVRLDTDYPSVIFVYPFARKPGGIIQLYNASNAENNYTSNWKDHFYGYQYLPATLKNTESPRRLKPLQLYFHSYSGEFETSVQAILSNINYIKTQAIIPIQLSRYCSIGSGFYTTKIERIGNRKWKIGNRKGLQTIRFDHAQNLAVDFSNSTGVIGCTIHNDSLYLYLDAAVTEAIIAMKSRTIFLKQKELSDTSSDQHDFKEMPHIIAAEVPFLLDSQWEIWDLKREGASFSFLGKGWGKSNMRWKVPVSGMYFISVPERIKPMLIETQDDILSLELDLPFNTEFRFIITPVMK